MRERPHCNSLVFSVCACAFRLVGGGNPQNTVDEVHGLSHPDLYAEKIVFLVL